MRTIRWIICCSVACWPLWGGAEIYQSRDASGNVVYSDRPLGTNSRKSDIITPPTGQSPAVPATALPQNDKATAVEAMEKGANGFLNKPFTDRQLNDALEELLAAA